MGRRPSTPAKGRSAPILLPLWRLFIAQVRGAAESLPPRPQARRDIDPRLRPPGGWQSATWRCIRRKPSKGTYPNIQFDFLGYGLQLGLEMKDGWMLLSTRS
jgi:hypothetical protein